MALHVQMLQLHPFDVVAVVQVQFHTFEVVHAAKQQLQKIVEQFKVNDSISNTCILLLTRQLGRKQPIQFKSKNKQSQCFAYGHVISESECWISTHLHHLWQGRHHIWPSRQCCRPGRECCRPMWHSISRSVRYAWHHQRHSVSRSVWHHQRNVALNHISDNLLLTWSLSLAP